jgi:hypothetical protein
MESDYYQRPREPYAVIPGPHKLWKWWRINPFTAEVALMRLLGSAPKSHLCNQRRSKVTNLSDLMTLFIDLGCLYCKQTQRAFNVFTNTLNWLKIDSVDQKFNWLECGNFSQDAGTPGTERVIAFSQLAVKGLKIFWWALKQQTARLAIYHKIKYSQQTRCPLQWTWRTVAQDRWYW